MSIMIMRRRMTISSVFCAVFLFCCIPSSYAAVVYVSQESTAGVGDFDSNILGVIESFSTTRTALEFYDWFDSTYQGSYSGDLYGGPSPISSMSQLFLVDASDGLALFVVHDNRFDGSGGHAEMQFDLSNDIAEFVAWDDTTANDPDDDYDVLAGGSQLTAVNHWGNNFTDGFAIGSLDGNWSMLSQFADIVDTPERPWKDGGITGWQAVSSDSGSPTISLALEEGRRVRLAPVPIPASILLLGTGLLGLIGVSRRKKAAL